jgi:hypothetical protein
MRFGGGKLDMITAVRDGFNGWFFYVFVVPFSFVFGYRAHNIPLRGIAFCSGAVPLVYYYQKHMDLV